MGDEAGDTFVCDSRRSVEETVGVLRSMSKRGKLAGFEHKGEGEVAVAAHGTPFDSQLRLSIESEGEGASVRGEVVLRPLMPVVFALVLVLTIFPGLPLTDSFMRTFSWYENLLGSSVETWMWYLPVTVLPAPFAWRGAMLKSRSSALEHARETFGRIRTALAS